MATATNTSPAPVGYLELIRTNANFRNIWYGQIISLLGDWFDLIASAALVGILTKSGLAVGSLFVVRMLAPFLISPLAGVVADRYNRKWVLIITDLSRAVVVLGFLLVRNANQLWLLYTITALQLGISGFFFPARNAILPDIAAPHEMGAANALSSATWSVMLAMGAALGGLASGLWGIYPAFVIDSVSFLLSAFFIARVTQVEAPALAKADKTIGAALQQYIDGLRYLRRQPDVLVITLHKAVNALILSAGFQVLQVAISQKLFVIGKEGGISLGLMFALSGIGTGVGPMIARRITGDEPQALRRAITIGYIIGGLGLVLTAPLFSFGSVLLGTLLRALGGGIVWVFSTQLLLQAVPNQILGRVFATEFAFFNLTSAISSALVGAALDAALSISAVIWWMAVFSVAPVILWPLWLRKRSLPPTGE
ncbi:MAG: MFS transporter [Caldilineaceae bacterium]